MVSLSNHEAGRSDWRHGLVLRHAQDEVYWVAGAYGRAIR